MSEIKEIDYIYSSYMKAQKNLPYDMPDKYKRNPEMSRQILNDLSSSDNILVTGSKGKGSISNFISSILSQYIKTGLYTNPHIINFNERFKINNEEITDEDLKKYILLAEDKFSSIEKNLKKEEFISPIGIQAAIALMYFRDSSTDFNVFECGKGVKYDDINNINRDYAVISTIFLEHTRELGETIEEIAENKSFIIRKGEKCAYTSVQEEKVLNILRNRAEKEGVMLKEYGRDFYAENIIYTDSGMKFDVVTSEKTYKNLEISMLGEHQCINASIAIAFCEDYLKILDDEKLQAGLKNVKNYGRAEIISEEPLIILDASINRKSAEMFKKILANLSYKNYNFIVGIPDDKDYEGVVKEIKSLAGKIILTRTHNPHYKFTSVQKEVLEIEGIEVLESRDIADAMNILKGDNTPICILGTTSLITEVKKYF